MEVRYGRYLNRRTSLWTRGIPTNHRSYQPTFAGPVPVERPRSKWPTVLGIIAIVLAGFGLLSELVEMAVSMVPDQPGAATQPAFAEPPSAVQSMMLAGGLIASVLLLVGGAACLCGGAGRQRSW